MKLTPHKGLFFAGLVLLFSNISIAEEEPCEGRTCLDDPGEAEVIAATGYEHTLFDSADNKCQHCHNDLYDTWKTSMHAKSWADPIFQSKYQDFLRLQVSKIGLYNPSTDKTYLPAMIQKSGQVCIKCHAPAAFYSNDYKLELKYFDDQNTNPNAYDEAKAEQTNLAPAYDPSAPATISSMARTGEVYTLTYSIGHKHNQEGINCSYCHSMETVRLMNDMDGDGGMYTLANDLKMGPIGPVVRPAGSDLIYSPDASTPDMNAFFALIGPDKGDHENTAKDHFTDWDQSKVHDGRYVMKSTKTGCETYDEEGNCVGTRGYYTGGPFYGPFGVTGLSNSRDDDLSMRDDLVKQEFQDAVGDVPDKFEDKHQFAAYGKALCLSCHQRSSLMLNPESNGEPGLQVGDDQFLELCSTWTAFSDGVGNNFEDTKTSPKCQHCHMEPLEGKTVLHQWDQPDVLFTKEVEPHLTAPFDPASGYGPVAEGYLNNHAFMGANTADFGLTKIKTGFEADMNAKKKGKKIVVNTSLQNKTAHMFPGAHPMRRVLTRVVVTDAKGNKLSYRHAKGRSKFKSITNEVAVLDGNSIKPGFETVDVKYNKHADVVIQGYTPDFEGSEHVSSQYMDSATVDWVSPDATVINSEPVCTETDSDGVCIGSWVIKGQAKVSKITDVEGTAYNFTRIYGRETGKRAPDGTHVIRPGFDSNIAADNRLKPNEMEKYRVVYNTKNAVFPLKVQYKVYYLKKGASGVYEDLTADDGFLKERSDFPEGADGDAAWETYLVKLKKAAIYEVFDKEVTIAGRKRHGHGHDDDHDRGHKDDD